MNYRPVYFDKSKPRPRWLRPGRSDLTTYSQKHSYRYHTRIWNAQPAWVDIDRLKAIYKAAANRADEVEVDHIVPLSNPIVCGLHVPWNLQIIPLLENQRKSNKYWPGMPMEQLDFFNEHFELTKQEELS